MTVVSQRNPTYGNDIPGTHRLPLSYTLLQRSPVIEIAGRPAARRPLLCQLRWAYNK